MTEIILLGNLPPFIQHRCCFICCYRVPPPLEPLSQSLLSGADTNIMFKVIQIDRYLKIDQKFKKSIIWYHSEHGLFQEDLSKKFSLSVSCLPTYELLYVAMRIFFRLYVLSFCTMSISRGIIQEIEPFSVLFAILWHFEKPLHVAIRIFSSCVLSISTLSNLCIRMLSLSVENIATLVENVIKHMNHFGNVCRPSQYIFHII